MSCPRARWPKPSWETVIFCARVSCKAHSSRLHILIQWKGHYSALEAVRNLSKEIYFSMSAKADRSIADIVSAGGNLGAASLHHEWFPRSHRQWSNRGAKENRNSKQNKAQQSNSCVRLKLIHKWKWFCVLLQYLPYFSWCVCALVGPFFHPLKSQ